MFMNANGARPFFVVPGSAMADAQHVDLKTIEKRSGLLRDRVKKLMDAAKHDAEAQYNTGLAYYSGNGVTMDKAMAIKWIRKAAKNGLAEAQFYLGTMYYYGEEVKQDSAKAIKWMQKAAEQGHADALDYLPEMNKCKTPVTFGSLVDKAHKRIQKKRKNKQKV